MTHTPITRTPTTHTRPHTLKRTLAVLVLAVAALHATSGAALADSTAKRQQIIELIRVSKVVDNPDELMPVMTKAMMDALKRSGVTMTADMNDIVRTATQRVVNRHYRDLMDRVVELYDRSFSEQEVRDILAFSKTEAGQRYTNVSPALVNRAVVLRQKWTQAFQGELRQEVANTIRVRRGGSGG